MDTEPLQSERRHKLMTAELRAKLPHLHQSADGLDAVAHLKLFSPLGRYTLYVVEFDGADLLYGYCLSPIGRQWDEWGYSSLSELAAMRRRDFGGMPAIERDIHWQPTTVAKAIAEAGR